MINSNLIELISKLNPKEFKELGEYIRSPFFNKNQSVINLYDYLSRHYPDFNEKNLEKENVYKKLFPKTGYNNGFMKTMMFNLSKLAEDYLGFKNYDSNLPKKKLHLINELYERSCESLFRKKVKEADRELDKMYPDAEFYRNKYDLKSIEDIYKSVRKNYFSEKKSMDSFYQGNISFLMNYFLIEMLGEYRTVINLSRVLNYDFDNKEVNGLTDFIGANPDLLENNLVKLHYYEVMLLKDSEPKYYYLLKELLLKEIDRIGRLDSFGTMTVLLNFTYFMYYSGVKDFMKERFELLKLRLKYKLFAKSDEGDFGPDVFEGTFNTGISMRDFKWTRQFIEDYKKYLPLEHRDNIVNYSYAKLHFSLGDAEKAADFLSRVRTPQYITLKYKVKLLNMMIFYEKGLLDSAHDAADAYRHFIANDKILHHLRKEMYSNFLKYFNELLKMKTKIKPGQLEKITNVVNSTITIIEREWLIEKLSGLAKQSAK